MTPDMIGSFILGIISGLMISFVAIKKLSNKKKHNNQFILNNHDKMIIDAIGSDIGVLMQYHGQKVKVEKDYYLFCHIDNDLIAVPTKCLVPIYDEVKF